MPQNLVWIQECQTSRTPPIRTLGFIWSVADKLRGLYRPPQYRRVMLPMTVLRRLDCVLEPKKTKVLKEKERLEAKGFKRAALEKAISKVAVGGDRRSPSL